MNRKGFTLVELLAVIAILAILVIIALPNVMGMFNQSKESAFTTELKEVYKAANNAWISDSLFETKERIYSKCDAGCDNELDMSGRKDIEYYIKVNKAGKVTEFYASDGNYQYSYVGTGLLIEDITSVQSVAELDSNEIFEITSTGAGNPELGSPITVCFYSRTNDDTTNIDRTNKTCYSKQTVGQCFSDVRASYLYNNEESNRDGNYIINCFRNNKDSCWNGNDLLAYQNCMNNACRNLYHLISSDDIVLPTSNGCYSRYQIVLSCLDGDTELEVYDKKKKKRLKKKLKDITYDDLILCWDFDKGETIWAKPFWIMKPYEADRSILLKFSDGTELKVVGNHRIFNIELNKFSSVIDEETNIGMHTYNSEGNIVKLTSKTFSVENTIAYNVITEKHINVFANGILASQGSNNIYKIKDMKFVKENRERFTKEELDIVPKEYVENLRLDEWITDEKGNKEETIKDMKSYVDSLVSRKM